MPVKDGIGPVKDGKEPVRDGKEPVRDGKEPVRDGKEDVEPKSFAGAGAMSLCVTGLKEDDKDGSFFFCS